MTAPAERDRWLKVQRVFHAVVDLNVAEQEARLSGLTEGEASLLAEVRALLLSHQRAGDFLETAGAQTGPTLADGAVVAGRYRITGFLAKGGMGEVYEALDTGLGETVALKILRPDLPPGGEGLDRFRREAQKARRVTHPNVCRVHDFGVHEGPGVPPRPFLTMEMLQGGTLADRLSEGPLTDLEADSIARDISGGVAAAHAAGVVHGDIKTANIILVEGFRPARAIVTDFGIAATVSGDGAVRPGSLAGTPDYMAPEQHGGAPATTASDIYSLGVVLHELATGSRPTSPPAPGALWGAWPVPGLAGGRDVIARVARRCLQPRPEDRLGTATLVLAELGQRGAGARRRFGFSAVAGIVIVALIIAWARSTPVTPEPGPASLRRSAAVLNIENASGTEEADWLADAFAEIIALELRAGESVRVIPGSTVVQAWSDLGLRRRVRPSAEDIGRLRSVLGADWLLSGAYRSVGASIRLDVRVTDRDDHILASVSEQGPDTSTTDVARKVSAALRSRLGLEQPASRDVAEARAALPSGETALRAYSEGLRRFRLQQHQAATDWMGKVVDSEPAFAMAYFHLASSLREIGQDERARTASGLALRNSGRLSREDRLLIEAQDQYLNLDPESSEQTYRTLFRFFPDNIEYGLRILSINPLPAEAARIIAELRRLPPPAGNDLRIDLAEGRLWFPLEVPGALAAARRAVARARALNAWPLMSRALYAEAALIGRAGASAATLPLLVDARRIAGASSDAQLVKIDSEMAWSLLRLGRTQEALEVISRVLPLAMGAGQTAHQIEFLYLTAVAHRLRGDLGRADKALRRAAAEAARFKSGNAKAWVKEEQGRVLRQRGQVKAARLICEEFLALGWDPSSPEPLDMVRILLDEGRTQEARPLVESSARARRERGQAFDAWEATVELARLEVMEGRFVQAEQQAATASAALAAEGHRPLETQALAVWARALIGQGRANEAVSILRSARGRFDIGVGYEAVDFATEEARALMSVGDSGAAAASARWAIERAIGSGFKGEELSARLLLGSIETLHGGAAGFRSVATRISMEARPLGLLALEKEALSTLASSDPR